jgi:hypothetical protein
VANLAKRRGTVVKESAALVGYGTAVYLHNGDELGIVAPSLKALKNIWGSLNYKDPLNEKMVRRVVYFPVEAMTTLRRRKRTTLNRSPGDSNAR